MLTILNTNYQVYLWHLGRPVPVPGVPLAPRTTRLIFVLPPGVLQSRPPTSHPLRPRGGAAAHQGPIQRDDRQLLEKLDIIKKTGENKPGDEIYETRSLVPGAC